MITVTVVLGWFGYVYADTKVGLVIHHQGPVVEVHRVDTYDEALDFNNGICKFTSEKFAEYGGGCSYKWLVCGDWVFQNQPNNTKAIHVRNWNLATDGIMLTYTDDEAFNKRTAYTARLLIMELEKRDTYEFCLFHADLDPTRRTDPYPFSPWLNQMGLRWDSRPYPEKIEGTLPEPRFKKWVKI